MVISCLLCVFVFLYYWLGWDTGRKLDNATYAKQTLAESGPYAIAVTTNPGISDADRQLVEDGITDFFDEQGFELVDAQAAVNAGGSVLVIHLDSTPIDPIRRTFSVDLLVSAYVYRLGNSGDYYKQGAKIYTSGKHGHATNDVFDEAISTTALNMIKAFHDQYEKDNP